MEGVAASADLVETGTISGKMLKDLYDLSFERGKDFPVVYEEEGRPQQSTTHRRWKKSSMSLVAPIRSNSNNIAPARRRCLDFSLGR